MGCLVQFLIIFFIQRISAISNERQAIIKSTLDRLLEEDYDIRLRPQYGADPLSVGMSIQVASIDSVSEVNMDYTLTLNFQQSWRDERLAFDGLNLNLTLDNRVVDKIWVPDTYFVNDKKSYIHTVTRSNKMLRIEEDGTIFYGLRVTTDLACMMNLRRYPMDEQNCTLEIESYGYTTDDIRFHMLGDIGVTGVENLKLAQFKVTNSRLLIKNITFATGSYPRVSLSFLLKRNIGFFILQTYLPCSLITILSWVSFWINHEATAARVALGITTVLTVTTISTNVRQSLPKIPDIKALDVYLICCFVFVFLALLEYAMVNCTYYGNMARQTKAKLRRKLTEALEAEESAKSANFAAQFSGGSKETIRYCDEESTSPGSIHQIAAGWSDNEENAIRHISTCPHANHARPLPTRRRNVGFNVATQGRARGMHNAANGKRRGQPSRNSVGKKRKGYASRAKKSLSALKVPKISDVSIIDKVARVAFPASFAIFNFVYWTYYIFF
uniref:gamma-aminobutyric acid receptor subunit beta-3-like n=1 Tax=Ciona intestinalis TaxID=7719 RepID=UPI000180BA99|nr:gamma-aminobutyric acid receptor subunit beta-3-like [Ciona intestinalis]|eukprot:XP_002119693.1 gamma-aminobutyric acid receptor subunit beta-3-like [Ciona intestinalis]